MAPAGAGGRRQLAPISRPPAPGARLPPPQGARTARVKRTSSGGGAGTRAPGTSPAREWVPVALRPQTRLPPPMRALVVGAGAWGAPCAARLASAAGVRSVTLIDATGVGAKKMASGSSSGPTRIYRLAHSDRARVRLAVRALDSWKRWSRESGVELLGARGLLWRSDADRVAAVAAALTAEHIPHTPVPAADVARFMPGLAPDGRPATWHPDAGVVWAAKALEAYMHAFARAGGELLTGPASRVTSLTLRPSGDGVVAALAGGGEVTADVAVLAPGAGAGTLINGFLAQPGADGHDIRSLAFTPRLQLTAHFRERSCGAPAPTADATDAHPCFIDGAPAHDPTMIMYAMPTPGIGYKAGLDAAVQRASTSGAAPFGDGDRLGDREAHGGRGRDSLGDAVLEHIEAGSHGRQLDRDVGRQGVVPACHRQHRLAVAGARGIHLRADKARAAAGPFVVRRVHRGRMARHRPDQRLGLWLPNHECQNSGCLW